MSETYRIGDLVTIKGTIDAVSPDAISVLVVGPQAEQKVRVSKSGVATHERGPLRQGDKCKKKTKAGTVEGRVVARSDTHLWVEWNDGSHGVEPATNLTR